MGTFEVDTLKKKLIERKHELDVYDIPYKSNIEYDNYLELSECLNEGSKKTYILRMDYIRRKFNESSPHGTHMILTNPTKFGSLILDMPVNMKNRENSLSTILAYLAYTGMKSMYPKLFTLWYSIFIKVNKELRRLRENNIPTTKQVESMINWMDVIKLRNSLEYGSKDHLLLSIYTYVPPRRQMDYANMRVYLDENIDPPKNHNYFQLFNKRLNSAVFYIHEYKNAQYLRGYLNKEIPEDFIKIIKYSLIKTPRDFLFVQDGDVTKPYSVQAFTTHTNRRLKALFNNQHFSVNTLRHSFATLIARKSLTLQERKKFATQMGHTVMKSLEYVLLMGNQENNLGEETPIM